MIADSTLKKIRENFGIYYESLILYYLVNLISFYYLYGKLEKKQDFGFFPGWYFRISIGTSSVKFLKKCLACSFKCLGSGHVLSSMRLKLFLKTLEIIIVKHYEK